MTHTDQPSLRTYQLEDREFLAQRARALLWNQAGTGKTPTTVAAIADLDGPAVVVCPKVAMGVWARQFKIWAPDYEVLVQSTTKRVDPPTGHQVLLTTYDRARVHTTGRFGIICDEAHLIKNERTARAKTIRELVRSGRSYMWQLTGTPILRYPDDIWGQLNAMGLAEQTYRTKTAFCKLFGGEYGVGGMAWDPDKIKPTAYDPLRNFMRRRMRAEVLELPPRTSEEWWVELPKRLAARFADICARYPPDSPTWEQSAAGGELHSALADLSAIKAEASLQSIQELEATTDNPVVVFTAHKDAARIIGHAMNWPVIDGDTPERQRTAFEHAFQAGAYGGLVLTIHAGGTAITLTRAKTIVFVSETYVPALNEQAADRVYRFGQEREVRGIYVRAESPLEDSLQQVLAHKRRFGKIG